MKLGKLTIIAGLLLGASVSLHAQLVTIDTTSAWDHSSYLNVFGTGGFTDTYGQTFTTGATATVLQSFSFQLAPLTVDFWAGVGTWEAGRIGTMVFESGPMNIGTGFDGFANVPVSTNNLQLASNTQYVAFFSTTGLQNPVGSNSWGFLWAEAYNGGAVVWFNNPDKAALTTEAWDGGMSQNDLAFTIRLATNAGEAVPEPSTYGLLGAGVLLGLAIWRRRAARR